MSLVILVPSRGRPDNAAELRVAFNSTSSLIDTRLMFVVDDDDPTGKEYGCDAIVWPAAKLGPREGEGARPRGCVAPLNWAANWLLSRPGYNASYVGFMGDDHRPRTFGWDAEYVKALNDGKAVVWGDDLLMHDAFPTQVAMDARIPRTLGYMAPPSFKHLCVDLVWKDWGQGLNRIQYLPEVVVEHMHPAAGKSELDQGYVDANSHNAVDSAEYYRWKEHDLPGELARLQTAFS